MPEVKNKRVLIVDDDNDILDVMKEALSYEGYEVRAITGTNDIFPDIIQRRPDLILMDYLLAGINGGELCHQIKNNSSTQAIPVIIMSAHPRVINSLGTYGCDAFIAKPFDLDDVTENIHRLITKAEKQYSC
ncbi:response regulator [Mucilaginibacter antarcticus]|uniref:Two-component system response regulator n=1 Tax=Mucilaginibacter antarcticus TaxID=1855725 RepID=A0ABW5XK96_9SPHI